MVQNLNQLYTENFKLDLRESTADEAFVFHVANPGMNTGTTYGPPSTGRSDTWKQSLE